MVQNAAVQALRDAEDLKQKIVQRSDDVVVSTSKTVLLTQLQKAYQKVLLTDLDYALDKKVEQDLWNVGFKNQIEALQGSIKDKMNPRRAESQALLNWWMQISTGFYISLLQQICTTFKLNLPFRCNIPVMVDCYPLPRVNSRPPRAASCGYICQYCLVHLGDLARYTRQLKMASSFYKQALIVSSSNGQPYNQLGLLRASRGDRLGAAYYHARGLAVGGPFQPAHNNLTRTLAQANTVTESSLTTEKGPNSLFDGSPSSYTRLNPSLFLTQYMSIHHHIIINGDLDKASYLAKGISSTLTALVATQQFQEETISQICCLSMYSIFSLTDGHKLSCNDATLLAQEEKCWLDLAVNIIAGTIEALLLPVHTTPQGQLVTYKALPAIKILMEWLKLHPDMLKHAAFVSRPQLWPGLCALLTGLQQTIKDFKGDMYTTIPLPEDEELRGFLPVDKAFIGLKYANNVTSEIYGDSIFDLKCVLPLGETTEMSDKEIIKLKKQIGISALEGEALKKDMEFVDFLRSYRLIHLGCWLVEHQKDNGTEYMSLSDEDGLMVFKSVQSAVENDSDLLKAIKEISVLKQKKLSESHDPENDEYTSDNESSRPKTLNTISEVSPNLTNTVAVVTGASGEISPCVDVNTPPSPIVISEADFREKVRDKKAGILKPQGSLERARIEKAALNRAIARDSPGELLDLQDSQDTASSCSTVSQDGNICSDVGSLLEPSVPKEKGKKTRTNVALQAILRKQEESNKQVKFLTPVTTPDSISEPTPQLSPQPSKDVIEKKIIQPKIIKSLASLPIDRKTGGILSLKDKSGGYPHLQKHEIAGDSKTEALDQTAEDTKVDVTDSSVVKHTSPGKPGGKKDLISGLSPNEKFGVQRYSTWSDNIQNKLDHKPSGRLQAQPNFSFFSPPGATQNVSITLPVVNPKEIDVRSAAMHKQKNAYGVGDSSLIPPDNYGVDPSISSYNYWSGTQGGGLQHGAPPQSFQRTPSRPPNANRSSNESYHTPTGVSEGQFVPQDGGYQSCYNMFNTQQGMQNSWWKPEQSYDHPPNYSNYQQPNMSSPNYSQNNSPYPPTSFYPQGQPDYSNVPPYNMPMTQDSPRFGNPIYSNTYTPPNSNTFSPMTNYNPGMFPQFSNRFGFPTQNQTKPGNEYRMNLYQFENQPFLMSPNQNIHNPSTHPGYQEAGLQQENKFTKGFKETVSLPHPQGKKDGNAKQQGDSLNTYSLFSSDPQMSPTVNQLNTQQSLWSGAGPSLLERLLEQQKQFKFLPDE